MTFYSYDWFSEHIPTWCKLLGEFANEPNLNFLEIGCFEGRASVWLLENILTNKTSRLTVIDIFTGSPEILAIGYNGDIKSTFLENIKDHKKKVIIKEGSSRDVLPKLTQKYDVIYVDGSHTYNDCYKDMEESFPFLKEKGIMIIDDYLWGDPNAEEGRPREAINDFVEKYKDKISVFSIPYIKDDEHEQFAFRKL